MKLSFRKIIASLVLISFAASNFSPSALHARNNQDVPGQNSKKIANTGKDFDLKDAFGGKKFERAKASAKGKNNYRLMIRSSD